MKAARLLPLGRHRKTAVGQRVLRTRRIGAAPSPLPLDPRFRLEAWAAWQAGEEAGGGELLRLEPRWLRYGYRLLLGMLVAALLVLGFGTANETASGPLLVQLAGRIELTSPLSGTVAAILRQPGDRVVAGETLVRLWDIDEAAELELIEGEWRAQLLARLRRPDDPSPAAALLSLAAQKRLAERRLAGRQIVAPQDGILGDLRVRPGQPVEPGRVLLTLGGGTAPPALIAFVPGAQRPLLHRGQPLRARFDGFPDAEIELEIAAVGDEVLSAEEARRLVPAGGAAALALSGPVVWVRAQLPAAEFAAGGQRLALFDGMHGRAEVVLRARRLYQLLFPWLEALRPARPGEGA